VARRGREIYLDTSFLVPYYLLQTFTPCVERTLRAAQPGTLLISTWTRVEFASVLARLVRMKALVDPDPPRIAFEEDTVVTFVVNDLVASDFRMAAELVLSEPSFGLRGPDALHLAVAASAGVPMLTLDRGLLAAARALGIEASDAGVLPG
jgi:uncharacterized protein